MKSVQHSFDKLSIQQQSKELENNMKAAGQSCLSSLKEVVHRSRKTDPRLKKSIIMSRRARRAWRSAAVDGEAEHKSGNWKVFGGRGKAWHGVLT